MLQHEVASLIGEADGTASGEALLIAGSDYELLPLDTPPVSREELEVIFASRIRTLYPGNPETTEHELLPNGGSRRNHLAIIMQKKVLEGYRNIEKRYPLFIASSILRERFSQKGKCAGILWTLPAAELYIFENSRLLSRSIHLHASGASLSVSKIVQAEVNGITSLVVIVSDDVLHDRLMLKKDLMEMKIPNVVLPLGECIKYCDISRNRLFSERNTSRSEGRTRKLGIALSLIFITFALIFFRFGAMRDRELVVMKELYAEKKAETAKMATLAAKVRTLEAATTAKKGQVPTAYEVLEAIAMCLQADCRIMTLDLNGATFKFEAEANNSLVVLRSLEASKHFTTIILHSASRTTSGKERLSLSGSFTYATL